MISGFRFLTCAVLGASLMTAASPVRAQTAPSAAVGHEAGVVASACLNNWQAPECLSAISSASTVLTVNYTDALQKSGHPADADNVKQHCAASTAAMHETVPANAMRSAMTECANTISDVSQKPAFCLTLRNTSCWSVRPCALPRIPVAPPSLPA